MMMVIALVGAAAVLASLWRRQWIDAGLAAIAAVALVLMAAKLTLPGDAGSVMTIDPANPPTSIEGARTLKLKGDGLSAAEWHDLPARPLAWTAPDTEVLRLEFPRRTALGRMFTLTVRRSVRTPARLQLLAENGQVIAESRGDGDLTVQWLPPVAERLVLTARLLDAKDKVIAQGPVPVIVRESAPLRVQGRFGAPSFDLRVLDQLLANSEALLDWQVTLGKTVTRGETARELMNEPNLLVIDAAWFEQAAAPARTTLLARVAQGAPLLVLGANARDAGVWSRTLQLALAPQPENKTTGAPLAMTVAALNPAALGAGEWTGSDGMVWTRPWQKGRIAWLGVGDWHRHAISDRQALALWWQAVLDRVGVERNEDVEWLDPEEMPLPGRRLEVCARGLRGDLALSGLKQVLAMQRRPDRADASCVAVWPAKPGWLAVQGQGSKPAKGDIYVYAASDWPMWQAAQRRDATARYAARTPAPAAPVRQPLPAWPFAVLFALAMLALWWRERR